MSTPAPRMMTIVTATVAAEREQEFLDGFRALAAQPRPDGMLRSELLRHRDGRWSLQTVWRDRDAVVARRDATEPSAVQQLLTRVEAEHVHDLLTLEAQYDA